VGHHRLRGRGDDTVRLLLIVGGAQRPHAKRPVTEDDEPGPPQRPALAHLVSCSPAESRVLAGTCTRTRCPTSKHSEPVRILRFPDMASGGPGGSATRLPTGEETCWEVGVFNDGPLFSVRSGGARDVERALVACWVSPGWSRGLAFPSRPEWAAYDTDETEYEGGLAQVVVARGAPRGRVSICHFLVDVFCLGVKSVIPPRTISPGDVTRHVHVSFSAFDALGLEAPLELAQHLVFGAVDYARRLGFEPADDDYQAAMGHLGTWSGPSAIVFGDSGKPVYNAGPYDNPRAVMETLVWCLQNNRVLR